MNKSDYEILKESTLDALSKDFSEDRMFIVGHILANEGILQDANEALDFCERPDKWRKELLKLIGEEETELIRKDCAKLTKEEQIIAEYWLSEFEYSDKSIVDCLEELY